MCIWDAHDWDGVSPDDLCPGINEDDPCPIQLGGAAPFCSLVPAGPMSIGKIQPEFEIRRR